MIPKETEFAIYVILHPVFCCVRTGCQTNSMTQTQATVVTAVKNDHYNKKEGKKLITRQLIPQITIVF